MWLELDCDVYERWCTFARDLCLTPRQLAPVLLDIAMGVSSLQLQIPHHRESKSGIDERYVWQGCQLSRIERETHAFLRFTPFSHWNNNLFIYLFFACQGFVMYEAYPYYVPAKLRQKFWGRKKKVSESPPPLWDLRDFIGWQRMAPPRISHSKPSSNVGSPDVWWWSLCMMMSKL